MTSDYAKTGCTVAGGVKGAVLYNSRYPLSPKVSLYGEGRFMGAKDTQFVGAYVGVAFNLGGSM